TRIGHRSISCPTRPRSIHPSRRSSRFRHRSAVGSAPRQQYVTESIQPPGYYLLVVPAFVTSSHGSYRQVYVVRLATAGLALLMVPCIFILARLVVPRSPWVWGAAGVLPALSRGYTFNLSQVTNDGL